MLGVIMDPSLSFHKHCNYVTDRIDKKNNMLMALAGSSWRQDKETLLLTYNALLNSIASHAAPVWSTNASDSSFKKIQTAQNAALSTANGAHKMDSIDHFHQESLTLKVRGHSDMLSAQYIVNCLEEDHVCHVITTQEQRPRPMKGKKRKKQREFNGTSTHLLDGYISANQRFFLHSWVRSRSIIGFPWDSIPRSLDC